jgi:hypothetical protein
LEARLLSKFVGALGALALVASIGVAETQPAEAASAPKATTILEKLAVKGRAPKTGYARDKFSDGWSEVYGCDTRNLILQRDLRNETMKYDGCVVLKGTLKDPYTGKTIKFVRGVKTSSKVQIDHVVALSDAWQKGAQKIGSELRFDLYHDPLNLLAVDGPTNGRKSDSDAASWLPPNKSYRCKYVARQIAVKYKYRLWVTKPEKAAMKRVLGSCPTQKIPLG